MSVGEDIVVNIVTRYELDGSGIKIPVGVRSSALVQTDLWTY